MVQARSPTVHAIVGTLLLWTKSECGCRWPSCMRDRHGSWFAFFLAPFRTRDLNRHRSKAHFRFINLDQACDDPRTHLCEYSIHTFEKLGTSPTHYSGPSSAFCIVVLAWILCRLACSTNCSVTTDTTCRIKGYETMRGRMTRRSWILANPNCQSNPLDCYFRPKAVTRTANTTSKTHR